MSGLKRAVLLSGIITLMVGLTTFTAAWLKSASLVRSDGLGYFMYARSMVLDLDTDLTQEYEELDTQFSGSALIKASLKKHAQRSPATGRVVVHWPIGAGLVMTPFYALGYGIERVAALVSDRPADSYGFIPQYFYGFGSLAYGLLGFWATFLCCRRVADDKAAYLSALGVLLAGPAVFYVFFHPSMAHAASFGLVSLLTLLWWRRWHEADGSVALLGSLLGVLIIIRYQNFVFGLLLVALILRVAQRTSVARALRMATIGVVACLIPLTLQIGHYSAMHGFTEASSGWQTEGILTNGVLHIEPSKIGVCKIDLGSANFLNVLFSCRHGAFYWAPILAIGFIGLIWAARKESWAWVFLMVFVGQVYLIGGLGGAWSAGHSFGMRFLTECAPFLGVGLAVLIQTTTGVIGALWWRVVVGILVTWNGLLILIYGLTIPRSKCVTFKEMAAHMLQALTMLFAGA